MSTNYTLFLVYCAFMSASLFGNGQTMPAMALNRGIHSTQRIGAERKKNDGPVETAIVAISGTTNNCSQVLFIRSNGSISYISCVTTKSITISINLTTLFFHDIHAALPLTTLPKNGGCLKSKSFGSSTYLILNTQTSPDVSCSVDSIGLELYHDVRAIQAVLHTVILPPQQPAAPSLRTPVPGVGTKSSPTAVPLSS